ncbi:MAG: hypothetical protein ACI4EU_02515 [Butyrivibrio sp.]
MKKLNKRIIAVAGAACILTGTCGCADTNNTDTNDDGKVSVVQEKKNYSAECEKIRSKEYRNMSFDECVFEDFPDIKSFQNLTPGAPTVTPEMALDAMRKSLDEYGLADKYPVEECVVSLTNKDENGNRPPVTELMDETDPDTGEKKLQYVDAFALMEKEMCLMMVADGYFKWINNTFNNYFPTPTDAEATVLVADGYYQNEEKYWYENIDDTSHKLLDGTEMTASEASDMAVKFVTDGVPYPPSEGVKILPESVAYHGDGEVGYYEVCVERSYNNIPFVQTNGMGEVTHGSSSYSIEEDMFSIFIADSTGVCGYMGDRASERFDAAGEVQDRMVSLEEAASIVEREMAQRFVMDFNRVGLRYIRIAQGISPSEKDGEYRVCWYFRGTNNNYLSHETVLVDAQTGELYFVLTEWE